MYRYHVRGRDRFELEREPSQAQVHIDPGGRMPEQKDVTLLGEAYCVLDAGHDAMALEDRKKGLEVGAAARNRCVDVSRQPRHAPRDHRDAPDDHARACRRSQSGDKGPERFLQRFARFSRWLRPLHAHRTNCSLSFLQAARA